MFPPTMEGKMLFLFIAMVRAAIGRLRNNRKNKAVHIALPPSQPSPILCTVRGKALETLRLNPFTPLCFLSEHKANDSGQIPSLEQFVSGIFLLPMDKKIENKATLLQHSPVTLLFQEPEGSSLPFIF